MRFLPREIRIFSPRSDSQLTSNTGALSTKRRDIIKRNMALLPIYSLPPIVFGLSTRWFHRWALLAGWLAGMTFGTIAAYKVATPTTSHWAGSVDIEFGHTVYIGLSAVILNIAVTVILTFIFKAARVPGGADETLPHQYTADPADVPAPVPATVGLAAAGAAGD